MRVRAILAMLVMSVAVPAFAQEFTTDQVLAKLDEKARVFTSLQADTTNYSVNFGVKAPDDKGKLFIKLANAAPRILWEVTDPKASRKKVYIQKGKGQVYFLDSNTYSERNVNSDEALQYILLGFGTRSATITKGYKPLLKGREAIGNVQAVVLELTSIDKTTEEWPVVTLWLDPETWTPVQTRLAKSPRKYQDFKYSDVEINKNISDSTFDLKIPGSAKKINL